MPHRLKQYEIDQTTAADKRLLKEYLESSVEGKVTINIIEAASIRADHNFYKMKATEVDYTPTLISKIRCSLREFYKWCYKMIKKPRRILFFISEKKDSD